MGIEKILRDSIEHSLTLRELAGNFDLFLKAVSIRRDACHRETYVVDGDRIPNHKIWKVRFEIRPNDECDPRPHFHILCKNNDVAFTIDDCQQLSGRCVDARTREMIRRFFLDLGGTKQLLAIEGKPLPSAPDEQRTDRSKRKTNVQCSVAAPVCEHFEAGPIRLDCCIA